MHIALIGCTSAGKTTLARSVVQACHDRGLQAWTSEDFAAHQLHFHWIRSSFARRRVLELASLGYALAAWRRYRGFHTLAFRLIRDAPGSLLYKTGLLRLTLRKTGVHEIVRRRLKDGQVVVSDNEAALQSVHHLFVHPDGRGDLSQVGTFAGVAPVPHVVAYLRTPERAIVERALRRGHRRLGSRSREHVDLAVRATVEVFDRLCDAPAVTSRLIVVDGQSVRATRCEDQQGSPLERAASLVLEGIHAARQRAEPETDIASERSVVLAPAIAAQLIDRLNEAVSYCHWKSNYHLAHSAAGDEDLDLLVDPSSLPKAQGILAELGFREAVATHGPRSPGIWHYFGCDPSTGALVHVHLFSHVLSGESFVKSHELPFRTMLLDHTATLGSIRVPAAAAELVLFVVRAFVKYGSLPDLIRTVRDDQAVRAELRWLESRASIEESLSLLSTYCPCLDAPLFLECLHALHNGDSFARRVRLARRVRRRLREFAVRGWFGRLLAYASYVVAYTRRKLTRSGKGKTWRSGGAVVAFVGPDATGKSTLVGEAARWLGGASTVRTAHLGKPPSSPWTWPANAVLSLARKLRGRRARWRPKSLREAEGGSPKRIGVSAIVFALRAVLLASERRRAARKTRRAAANGNVVLCDRYPTATVGAMDGPRLTAPANAEGALASLFGLLARMEGRLYHGLPQPDVLIELAVSVEAAKQRNRDRDKAGRHTDEDLESRHGGQPGTWAVSSDRRWRISTEGPFEETALMVKHAIWGGM